MRARVDDRFVAPVVRPVIGRCPVKGCKQRRRNMVSTRMRSRGSLPAAWLPVLPGGVLPSYMTVGELLARDPSVVTARSVDAWRGLGWVCPEHDRPMTLAVVIGTYDPSRACDGRCMGATGPRCDCACGGDNHGRSWDDVTFVEEEQPVEAAV